MAGNGGEGLVVLEAVAVLQGERGRAGR